MSEHHEFPVRIREGTHLEVVPIFGGRARL